MRPLYASLVAAMTAASLLPAAAGTLLVPSAAYPTIQSAVSAAKSGDTVLVSAKPNGGVYNEAVTITTPNIILQGRGNPIIDGTGLPPAIVPIPGSFYTNTVYPNGIDIRANSVAVRGLTVQNMAGSIYASGGAGINAGYSTADGVSSYGFSGIHLSGVTVSNAYDGIVINGSGAQLVNGTYVFTTAQDFSLVGCTLTGCLDDGANISSTNNLLISGNKVLGNNATGLVIGGGFFSKPIVNALIAGNVFKNNAYDGLDVSGTGVTVTANESASNGSYGIMTDTLTYSFFGPPSVMPGAAPTSLIANSAHDNSLGGLWITGAQAILGNSIANNAGYGLYLEDADSSTISFNAITGTALATPTFTQAPFDNGTGIFANNPDASYGPSVPSTALKIVGNQISGSAGDGIYLGAVTGCTVSANNVSSNLGVGIHASDFPSLGNVPNTITQNHAVHNTYFDARDDSNAADDLSYNGSYFYGDNQAYGASINIWTKNSFGTTDPAGLSK